MCGLFGSHSALLVYSAYLAYVIGLVGLCALFVQWGLFSLFGLWGRFVLFGLCIPFGPFGLFVLWSRRSAGTRHPAPRHPARGTRHRGHTTFGAPAFLILSRIRKDPTEASSDLGKHVCAYCGYQNKRYVTSLHFRAPCKAP